MQDIAIYGAGGFGRETAWLLRCINEEHQRWNLMGFFDDRLPPGTCVDEIKVLGGIDAVNKYRGKLSIAVAIADPIIKKSISEKLAWLDFDFPTLVHPKADTGAHINSIGKGCIITSGVVMTTGIYISDFVIINLHCTIGHDVTIGNYTSIMPGCSISGNVRIGHAALMGTGARILQNLNIGDSCIIGAGAVVTKDVPAGAKTFGVPAREK